MLLRRLLILLAVLMALSALASLAAPRQPPPRTAGEPGMSPRGAPPPEPVEKIVDAGAAEPARVVVEVGTLFVLEVRADTLDTVSLEGLDAIEPVDPESPAHFELLAEIAGTYPIRLLEAERELGTLEIREAG